MNSKDQDIINLQSLVLRTGIDGTMLISVPPNWTVGGGNMVLAAVSPGETMGVLHINDLSPMVYDGAQYIAGTFFPYFQCGNTIIHARELNTELMTLLASQGLSCQAENFAGETFRNTGVLLHFFLTVNYLSMPFGGIIANTFGFFAQPSLFKKNARALWIITSTLCPNQGQIQANQRIQGNRFDQISQTITETDHIVYNTISAHNETMDRMTDKYSYYSSGEDARYSSAENRIFVVDGSAPGYAENPRYPGDVLQQVPDHLWNKLPHERDY